MDNIFDIPHHSDGLRMPGLAVVEVDLSASPYTAIVTGGCSGLGAELAKMLLRSGASVGAQMADGRSALLVVSVSISSLPKRR